MTGIEVIYPNGGETFVEGTTQEIRWNTYGATVGVNLMIEYSDDGGATWVAPAIVASTVDDGVFEWTVPTGVGPDDFLVRVTSEASGSPDDVSDGTFRIFPASLLKADLTMLSLVPLDSNPDGDETISVDVTVRNDGNTASGVFYVDLFFDRTAPPMAGSVGDRSMRSALASGLAAGGQEVITFSGITSASAGIWRMHAFVDSQGLVNELNEIDDDNREGPEVLVWRRFWLVSPAAGDVISQGATWPVTWNSTLLLAELVDIEISTDNGASWSPIVANTANDGSHGWVVSCDTSTECLVRVREAGATLSDATDGIFTVKAPMDFLGGGCAAPAADGAGGPSGGPAGGALLLLLIAAVPGLLVRSRARAG